MNVAFKCTYNDGGSRDFVGFEEPAPLRICAETSLGGTGAYGVRSPITSAASFSITGSRASSPTTLAMRAGFSQIGDMGREYSITAIKLTNRYR